MILAHLAEPVEILRPSDRNRAPVAARAVIQERQAFIQDVTVDVMRADVIVRHLPNGNDQYLLVEKITVHNHPQLGHIELKISETDRPRQAADDLALVRDGDELEVVSTWLARDLPVLRAVLVLHEQDPGCPEVLPETVVQLTGLSMGQVQQALRALEAEPAHVAGVQRRADGTAWLVNGVTVLGRQRGGAWPDPACVIERLISELQDIADNDGQPEKRSRARTLLSSIGGASREITVEVLGAALTKAVGLG